MAVSVKQGIYISVFTGFCVVAISALCVYFSPGLQNSAQAYLFATLPGLFITVIFLLNSSVPVADTYTKGTSNKITEQEENNAFFFHLIKNNVDGIALIDQNANVFYQSPAAEKISGFTPAEVMNRSGFEFMHPDDREMVATFFGGVMAEPGVTKQIQYRSLHKDGHYMWVEANVLNLLKSNEIKCVLVNYRDISKHMEAEEKIRLAERKFRALVENDFDAVIILNEKAKPVYRSPAAEKITGFSFADRETQEAFELFYEQDRNAVKDYWEQSLKNPGKPYYFTTRMNHKNGTVIWAECVQTNLLSDPAIEGMVVNYRDITDRILQEEKLKQSELLYRAVVENSIDLIMLFDKDGRVKYRSPSVAKLTGVSNEEREQQGFSYLHPKDIVFVKNNWDALKATSGETFTRVLRVKHKKGHYLYIECSVTNLLAVEGIDAIVFNGRDITERKMAEEQIQALNETLEKKVALRTEQLEAVNKELEAFSYSVSHDLKAPLRVIEGYAKLLARPKNNLSEDMQRDLLVISENAIRMGHLISALLNFSRMGRAPLNKKVVNMNELAKAAVSEVQSAESAHTPNINLGLLNSALCDQSLIYRVWVNLVHNAFKYSRNKPNACIEIGMAEKNGEQVYFIKDNGVGFDMKNADRLFSVFQRLHKESDFEGTGVGLALVNSIIKKHDGKIWAEAAPNEGATFYFSIPVLTATNN